LNPFPDIPVEQLSDKRFAWLKFRYYGPLAILFIYGIQRMQAGDWQKRVTTYNKDWRVAENEYRDRHRLEPIKQVEAELEGRAVKK